MKTYEDTMSKIFGRLFDVNYYDAIEKLDKVRNDFYNSDKSVMNFTCSICGEKIRLNLYNKNNKSLNTDGVVYCDNCNHYIEIKSVTPENGKCVLLLRPYEYFEESPIIKEMDEYFADNISVDDWKSIFSGTDLSERSNIQLLRIKTILENKGIVFDNENNDESENE